MSGVRALALVLGFWLLLRSISKDSTGRTLIDHLIGNQASRSPYLTTEITASGALTSSSPGASSGTVDPFPQAVGSRLDQGFDLTAKDFLAPFSGQVVESNAADPGWAGGGYLAIRNSADPSQVIYMAEGLLPIVKAGSSVTAGERVALPARNPYNMAVGNIEAGWANPASPGQPLAQVAKNRPGAAKTFYQWLLGLGGPRASSTAGAGFP